MKKVFSIITVGIILFAIGFTACKKDDPVKPSTGGDNSGGGDNTTEIKPGNDPNFKIVANKDAGFTGFNRKVEVFGISIYAVPKVEDAKLLHAANVMAQYLDNNEDGTVDDEKVLNAMKSQKAFLFMWASESDMNKVNMPSDAAGQDLGNGETNPSYISSGKTGRFDAALEEVLHIINLAGHAVAYPDAFGMTENSKLTKAMDIARGGKFTSIPATYPSGAWYTYNDKTCGYLDCMTVEYLYWALTSILGAQENRLDEIGQEWKLNTKAKVQASDVAIYNLLTDPQYKMPTVVPDGTYKR